MSQRRIYQDEFPYFVTTKTKEGVWFFDETKCAKLLSDIILQACQLKKHILYAYCIMPDHLHVLVGEDVGSHFDNPTAPTERCAGVEFEDFPTPNPARVSVPAVGDGQYNISQLMYAIKSYFINELRKRYNIDYSIWQKRFNTRIVDTEERLGNTIKYIKNNPQKAGLPKKYQLFPYMYFDMEKILDLL